MDNTQFKTEKEKKNTNHVIFNRQVKPAYLQRNESLISVIAESHEKAVTVVHQQTTHTRVTELVPTGEEDPFNSRY